MTVFTLALSELKRMTVGILPKLTIVALTLIPLLYGATYLYANWDPYGNLDQLKAAVVVDDQGTVTNDGKKLAVGEDVANNLIDGHKFDWVKVSSDKEADDGVASGKYNFALKIPATFSANLASPENFDAAKQAMLDVTTNDANNYLLTSIVDKVSTQVHDSVAQQVGETTANMLLTGYGTIHTQMLKAADGAQQLADGAASLKTGASQLHSGTGELVTGANQLVDGESQLVAGTNKLNTGATQLSSGLDQLSQQTSTLPGQSKQLADGAAQVAAGNATLNTKVQSVVTQLNSVDAAAQAAVREKVKPNLDSLVASNVLTQTQEDTILAQISSIQQSPQLAAAKSQLHTDAGQIQQLAAGSQAVSDGAAKLSAATPTLTGAISQADSGAQQLAQGTSLLAANQQKALDGTSTLAKGASKLDDGAAQLDTGTSKLSAGATELAHQIAKGAGEVPNPTDAQKENAAKVMGNPVSVNNVSQASAGTYGAGLAPFFMVLALWIGALMLVQVMRPLTQRALTSNAASWKIATGGWLPFAAVAMAQGAILYGVVHFSLGLDVAHPWMALGLMMLASIAFTAIVQGLVALLGTPGKLVALVLMVVQLVSSGGTFPWQTTPEPLHIIHDILPMSYTVEGMRHLLYGADLAPLIPTVAVLLGFTVLGLLMSVVAVRKRKFFTLKTLQPEIAS